MRSEGKEAALRQEGLTAAVRQRHRQNTTGSNTAQGILSNLATLLGQSTIGLSSKLSVLCPVYRTDIPESFPLFFPFTPFTT